MIVEFPVFLADKRNQSYDRQNGKESFQAVHKLTERQKAVNQLCISQNHAVDYIQKSVNNHNRSRAVGNINQIVIYQIMYHRDDNRHNNRQQNFCPPELVVQFQKMLIVVVKKLARGEKNRQCEQNV